MVVGALAATGVVVLERSEDTKKIQTSIEKTRNVLTIREDYGTICLG